MHNNNGLALLKNRFWLSLIFTLPVLAYSQTIDNWFNLNLPAFPGSNLVPFVFSTIIFFFGGLIFIKGAWGELKSKLPGMMTLVSLAIIVSYVYSAATQFFIKGDGFFWELATLITIMLLGHYLEMLAIEKAENSLGVVKKLLPDKAEKLVDGSPQIVPIAEIKIGDSILVRPGARIPVDGVVIQGVSSADESIITGESEPVEKMVGDEVIAGSINQNGPLTVKTTKIGNDTIIFGIERLVAEALVSKSKNQILADKAAFILTIGALFVAIVTFIIWSLIAGFGTASERAVSVLIIACPHALGLAIPLVVSISTALAVRNGLLIRSRLALEEARKIDIVLFDKTGTLTAGKHSVTNVWAATGFNKNEVIRLAASVEQNSEHVIGKGIVKYAKEKNITTYKITKFDILPGLGAKANVNGNIYIVAGLRYINEKNLSIPSYIKDDMKKQIQFGQTEVYLVFDNKIIGALTLADIIRKESEIAIQQLVKQGIQVAMITGDNQEVAGFVADKLGITKYFAGVAPVDKASKVKELQNQGLKVAMVGDGINDAPALAQSDVGIAIGTGTDIAIKSADIMLVNNDPRDVVKIIKLSEITYKKMVQNLIWATGYNMVAIPIAAGVLSEFGIILTPAVGAILMSMSTIIVAINAQSLRNKIDT